MQTTVMDTSFECSTIISTLTATTNKPPTILVCIQEETNKNPFSHPLHAFIDSGAMGNFIHPHFIEQNQIPTKLQTKRLGLQTVTGKTFFTVKEQATVTLITQHG